MVVVCHAADERSKKVSFEPVDAEGAVITGLLVVVVVSLLVGGVVVIDIFTLSIYKPPRPRRRSRRIL